MSALNNYDHITRKQALTGYGQWQIAEVRASSINIEGMILENASTSIFLNLEQMKELTKWLDAKASMTIEEVDLTPSKPVITVDAESQEGTGRQFL